MIRQLLASGLGGLAFGGAIGGLTVWQRDLLENKQPPSDGHEDRALKTHGLTAPYHATKGGMVVLGGSIPKENADKWLTNERLVVPRLRKDGRIPCLIVLSNFEESNLGPHSELQFSMSVKARKWSELSELPDKPFSSVLGVVDSSIAAALFNNTDACYKYNRYVLGHKVNFFEGDQAFHVDEDMNNITFDISTPSGGTLIRGKIAGPNKQGSNFLMYAGLLGSLPLWQNITGALLGAEGKIVNRGENKAASSRTKTFATLIREPVAEDQLYLSNLFVPDGMTFRLEMVGLYGKAAAKDAAFDFLYLYHDEDVL